MLCETLNENHKFRFCVGAVIIENDCVLMVKSKSLPCYSIPECGVKMTETAETAVERLAKERIAMEYKVDKLVFVLENFFRDASSKVEKRCHELSFYFLMKPKHQMTQLESYFEENGEECFLHWVPMSEIEDKEVFPNFLKSQIKNVKDEDFEVKHLVSVCH